MSSLESINPTVAPTPTVSPLLHQLYLNAEQERERRERIDREERERRERKEQEQKERRERKEEERNYYDFKFTLKRFFILLFLSIWFIIGIIGFVMSLICIFYKSSTSDKFLGVIIALIFGPFFWLYYIYNNNYCNRNDL